MQFRAFKILSSCTVSCSMALLTLPAPADVLQLTNGDHYSGTVISMTTSNLQFQSEIQGLVKIPRDKVASITLRPVAAPVPNTGFTTQSAAIPNSPTPQAAIRRVPTLPIFQAPLTTPSNAPAANGDVVKQLKAQGGVDAQTVDDLQKQLMGNSNPEVTKMFNEMVGGLMSGKLSVNDLRAQARNSIAQIQAAKKDLGGDADMNEVLDGYVGILEKFLSEAGGSDADASKKAAPAK